MRRALALTLTLTLAGCNLQPTATGTSRAGRPQSDWSRGIVSTRLAVDIGTERGRATLEIAAGSAASASFEIGDLEIAGVEDASGRSLDWVDRGRELDVGVAPGEPATLVVTFRYTPHAGLEGAVRGGHTFTWPYHCGNLFPCRARPTPADGTTFALELAGVPDGLEAIYPHHIDAPAPPYMLAWAVGHYRYRALGKTQAGTEVGIYHHPDEEAAAIAGTQPLRDAFDWLERTLGAYRFGPKVASVSVPFAPGTFAGMEHHPYWHIASSALDDITVHVHEAVHGWYGNGVRMACWSDFVLSEGVTTYLTGRALEAAGRGDHYWQPRERHARHASPGVAWPADCEVDVLTIPDVGAYVRGALFMRALERRVGRATLDAVLRDFYAAHERDAARFQDLLDALHRASGYDPTGCAETWLRDTAPPGDFTCPG